MTDASTLTAALEGAKEMTPELFWRVAETCGAGRSQPDWLLRAQTLVHVEAWESVTLALIERVKPGWVLYHLGADATGYKRKAEAFGWTAEISNLHDMSQGQAPTPALALCIALLRAMEKTHD